MLSYQIVEWDHPLEGREHTVPEPRDSEVLLRVDGCGVCRSDLSIRSGYFDAGDAGRITMASKGVNLPFTMGHEVVGEVVAVGSAVRETGVGDQRVLYPWIGCGECRSCRRGHEVLCRSHRHMGTKIPGGYAEYVVVPHERYLVDYSGIPASSACTCACAGLTAYSALGKIGYLDSEDHLLVIGAGGLGLSATRLLPALTDAAAIVADVSEAKRRMALDSGAAFTLDPSAADAGETIREITGGYLRAAIDFVGSPETAKLALESLDKGGVYVIVGLFGGSLTLGLPELPFKNRTIIGSYLGSVEDMRTLMGLVRDGRAATTPVTTRPMSAVNEALDELSDGVVPGRTVLVP
jgi:D-arabinose 1-dehydrogenase-like Zn-dependent alcohol dehydrogenase